MILSTIYQFNVKRSYYTGIIGWGRFGCEIVFVVLLVFYFVMEVLEIVEDIQEKQKDQKNIDLFDKRNNLLDAEEGKEDDQEKPAAGEPE